MKKKILLIFSLFGGIIFSQAQTNLNYDLKAGLVFQKTQYLYVENGIGFDYSSKKLLDQMLHLKFTYLSSRLGSAIGTNAVPQDNFLVGADWRFLHTKDLQIMAGLNAGYFHASYGNDTFDVLPASSMLLSAEAGLVYNFKIPLSATLSAGYNFISGNGVDVPGSIFPVFYKLGVYYTLPIGK